MAESREKDGRERLTVRVEAEIFYRNLIVDRLDDKRPAMVHPSVTRTELKLEEAKYFHGLLCRSLHHEAAILFHLDATLAAMDSTIETLKSECGKKEGFAAWQRERYQEAVRDESLLVFRLLRNRSVHMGLESPRLHVEWESRHHLDGTITGALRLDSFSLVEMVVPEPVEAISRVMGRLEEWIREAKRLGFLAANKAKSNRTTAFKAFRERQSGTWEEVRLEGLHVGVRPTTAPRRKSVD